jgi:hypothetical protein
MMNDEVMFVFYKENASRDMIAEAVTDLRSILKTDEVYAIPSSLYFRVLKQKDKDKFRLY